MDMPVRGGHRPSSLVRQGKTKSAKLRRYSVAELAERYELGLDLATGRPLSGEDIYDHSQLQGGRKEREMNEHWNEMLDSRFSDN